MTGVVWCTGAGKGIGRAVALRYASDGKTVAASARTAIDLETLAADAEGQAGLIVPFALDVTDEPAVVAAVERIEDQLGPIEVAVLSAGTHIQVHADRLDSAAFRTLVEVNLMGVVHGVCAVLPRFIARGSGHIAVVASLAGYVGLPTGAAYGATKAALINMCEALKPELDALGITLTLINPGFVKTPLTDRNDFPMPFLMDAEKAADRIVDGLSRRQFEITFPKRLSWVMKVARILPYPGFFFLSKRFLVRKY